LYYNLVIVLVTVAKRILSQFRQLVYWQCLCETC